MPKKFEKLNEVFNVQSETISTELAKIETDLEKIEDECIKNHVKVLGWLIAENLLENGDLNFGFLPRCADLRNFGNQLRSGRQILHRYRYTYSRFDLR